ncbi:MAG TPA: exonuclease SbcCD subunit D [Anaerolineales bacterium]|nr:exonuclease SbcCD subunit D [Anaerolineales bacterium]
MPAPIRLVHFADLHVGMENYGKLDPATGTSSRVRDFLDRLDEVIEYALAHDADLAVFAGDAFKTRDPEPTQQREFARRIKRLADRVPTLLLVGNHDLPGSTQKATSVDIFRALDVPNIIVGHKPESRVVETARGPVFLAWVPYPTRNRLLSDEEHRGKSVEELDQALRAAVIETLDELAEAAGAADMPRVLAGHFSVGEARYGSERSVMLGRDVSVARSTLAAPAWDYIALGHIHRHQVLAGNPPGEPILAYSGSLERIDFGEEKEAKGFCWVELTRGATHMTFVAVHARPFITLRANLQEADDPTAQATSTLAAHADEVAGAVVRAIVTLRHDQLAQFDAREVERLLAAASHLSIEKDITSPVRARLGSDAAESLTPRELLERYFALRNTPPERLARLLAAAEPLIEADPDGNS